ncbi:MAG: FecR domain-containing protein [Myxococcales bacterium]|nr:FecR domain-containing protein [Myxococcales bacterium]
MKSADESLAASVTWSCQTLSDFRRDADDRLELPPAAAQHLATCDACRRADRLIAHAVELGRIASTSPRPRVPDVSKVLAAVRERHPRATGRPAVRRGPFAIALAVAIVAAATTAGLSHLGSNGAAPAVESAEIDVATRPAYPEAPVPDVAAPAVVPRIPSDYEDIDTGSSPTLLAEHGIAQVAVDPNSRLLVASWSLSETRLVLGRGQLEAHVERRQPGQRFEIRTEFATVKVIGTRFFVTHKPGRSTRITGIEGLVTVETPDGRFVTKIGRHESVTLNAKGVVAPSIELPDPIPTSFLPPEARPPVGRAPATTESATKPTSLLSSPAPTSVAPPPLAAQPAQVVTTTAADAAGRLPPRPPLAEPEPATRLPGPTAPTRAPKPVDVGDDSPSPVAKAGPAEAPRPEASRPAPRLAEADVAQEASAESTDLAPPTPVPTADAKPVTLKDVRWLLADRRDAEAVTALEALARDPAQPRAQVLTLLGDARRLQGRWADARVYYEAVLAIDDEAQALPELANLLDGPLGDPEAAAALWARYLDRRPNGRHAVTAHRELAGRAEDARDTASAEHHWRAYLSIGGQGRAKVRAVVAVGRALLGRGAVDDAVAWYSSFMTHDNPKVAEAALVGLMRARLSRGDTTGLRDLAREHARRFPKGARRAEVERLLETITE